ncbi:MAG: hypothetical protein JXB60_07295 [Candidatus Cloacimonetes bacterium]|nr:hypothetical protein [Candidatus Cloacimonadota bacterium]
MRSLLVGIIVLFLLTTSCLSKTKGVDPEDFLVVIIDSADIEKEKISIDLNDKNTRFQVRSLHADFLKDYRDVARYIILDFWYRERGDSLIDNYLVAELHRTKCVSLCCGGIENERFERTNPLFLNAVREAGHTVFGCNDQGIISFKSTIGNEDFAEINFSVSYRQMGLVLFTHLNIKPDKREIYSFSTAQIEDIPTISYSKLKERSGLASNKILILVSLVPYKDHTIDIHELPGYGKIPGSILLANMILNIQQ